MKPRKAVLAAALVLALPAHAGGLIETGPGISYSNGAIVVAQFDAGPVDVIGAVWQGERDNYAVGLGKRFELRRWRFDLGAVYAKYNDNRLGTHGNFALRVGYQITPDTAIGWRHFSNGDAIFDAKDNYGRPGNNRGEDFLTLSVRF